MKITGNQLMILVQTMKDTLIFYERKEGDPFTFNHETRLRILDEIFNQQGNELKEIE